MMNFLYECRKYLVYGLIVILLHNFNFDFRQVDLNYEQ